MYPIISGILKDILRSFYGILHIVLPMTLLFMFYWMYREEHGKVNIWNRLFQKFRREKSFRKMLLLVFYSITVLYYTLFSRTYFEKWPLRKVWGTWGLHLSDGSLYLENFENALLFLPLLFLFWINFADRLPSGQHGKLRTYRVLLQSAKFSAVLSVLIEASQLVFRKGTVQISDLVFNVAGGMLGGGAYLLLEAIQYKIKKNSKESNSHENCEKD